MSYVNSVLQPGERVLLIGRLHWIVFWHAILFAVLGIVCTVWAMVAGFDSVMVSATMIVFGVLFAFAFVRAWFIRWTTEMAVTDRRVIYKTGFVTRHTVEINMDKVASVDVDQSILGRMLDYGTVSVIGAGGAQNAGGGAGRIESLPRIASPLKLRSAITAK